MSTVALKSMTGYGRARASEGAVTAEADARSVNARYLQVRCRLPGELTRLEPRIEALVKKHVARGTVDVSVRMRTERSRGGLPRINKRALSAYKKQLDALGGGEAGWLLGLPGVVSSGDPEPSERALERTAFAAARDAVEDMAKARGAEGRRLRAAITRELSALRRHVATVRRSAPAAVRKQHEALRKRLSALLDGTRVSKDDATLMREVALLADRSDVTEEIDRLVSHLQALGESLGKTAPVGRQIDFLLQEVGREVNTIGSKCSDTRTSARVIECKSAVERLREQAANIE